MCKRNIVVIQMGGAIDLANSLKSQTLNQQVISDIPPKLTTTIAAKVLMYAAFSFKVEFVLKFLWSLAPVYFAYETYMTCT